MLSVIFHILLKVAPVRTLNANQMPPDNLKIQSGLRSVRGTATELQYVT